MKHILTSISLMFLTIRFYGFQNEPLKADLHVHLTNKSGVSAGQRYDKAAALSKKMGVVFGIAEEINYYDLKKNDDTLQARLTLVKKYSLYLGLQVNQPGWDRYFSKDLTNKVDYIMEDALRFPDKNGQVRLLWYPDVVFTDAQDFMERYVAYNLIVLSDPINIWVNPTYLPESLQKRYDELWTDKRMKRLIDTAVKNKIAIEINSRYKIPSKKFIQMAKAAGAHFTFGSNQHDTNIGEIEWSVKIAEDCGLTKKDFFIPQRTLATK